MKENVKLPLNILSGFFQYLPRTETFEMHLVSKRIQQKYWDQLSLQILSSPFQLKILKSPENLPPETLLSIVQASKYNLVLSSLSSTCITLLNKKHHYNFSNIDLSGTYLAHSDLSFGIFQNINFCESDLKFVNFSRSYLNNCDFSGSSMHEAEFGSQTFTGHLQSISALAISSDAKLLFSAGYDKLIKVWKLPMCTLVKTLKGHLLAISSISISSDSSILISASENIRIWDVESGNFRVLVGHGQKVTGVSMCLGNGYFVSCSIDGTVKLWITDTGRCKRTFQLETPLHALMISDDGKIIITGATTGEIALWNCKGQILEKYKSHISPIRSVYIAKNLVVSGGDDGQVVLHDLLDKSIRLFTGHSDFVTCVKIQENFIFSCGAGSDCSIRKWDILTGTCLDVIIGDLQGINAIVVSQNSVISAGKDKTIRITSSINQDVIADWIECVTILDNGEIVLTGCRNGLIRMWKEGKQENVWDLKSKVMSIDWKNGFIAAGCWDMNIYIRGGMEKTMVGHMDAVNSIQFCGEFLFSGGSDGLVKIWAWEEGYCISTLPVHNGYVHRVISNSKFAIVSSGCSNTKITIWDLENDSTNSIHMNRGRVKALAMCENLFATGASTGLVEVWDFNARLLATFSKHSGAITELMFFMGNLITCAEDSYVYVWDWSNNILLMSTFGFIPAKILKTEEKIVACQFIGSSLQFYEVFFYEISVAYKLLWRTVGKLELLLCNFKRVRGLPEALVQEY